MVYDPIGGDEGTFVWQGGRAEKTRLLVQSDVMCVKPRVQNPAPRPIPEEEMDAVPSEERLLGRLRRWVRRSWEAEK